MENNVRPRYPIVTYPITQPGNISIPRRVVDPWPIKGSFEKMFFPYLQKAFPRYIHDDYSLPETNYRPDFVYANHDLKRFIDIEIDEAYTYLSGTLTGIHYCEVNMGGTYSHVDDKRNRFFNERGWTVIRFSEHQVRTDPHSCIHFIEQVILVLSKQNANFLKSQHILHDQWTLEEALQMAANSNRGTAWDFFD